MTPRRTSQRRGVSLAEILVGIVILGLMLSLALLRHGSEESRADSDAVARILEAELKAARAQARATQRPVALCFPSTGSPISQSYYRLTGLSRGRIVASKNLATDFEEAVVAVGFWGSAAVERPQEIPCEVNPLSWLPANFDDYAVIFDPQGRVTSNDLPLQDGEYRLLVCSSVEAVSGAPSGTGMMPTPPDYYQFRKAAAAHTIALSPEGTVRRIEGAPGLEVYAHPFPLGYGISPPLAVTPARYAPPVIDDVSLQAAPHLASVGTVTRDGVLNVRVEASDPSGDDLILEWSSTKVSGAASDAGYYSKAGPHPMEWNYQEDHWESTITWAPPDDAQVGDIFDLSFVLSNSAGSATSSGQAILKGIEIVPNELLFATGNDGVYKIHKNGTGFERVMSNGLAPNYINISPDGSRMIWDQSNYDRDALYVGSIDGTGARWLFDSRSIYYLQPVWNNTGTKIFMAGSRLGVLSINPDGTGQSEVLPRVPGHSYTSGLDLTNDGEYIAAIIHGERTPGDRSTYKRDLWVGKLNQANDPPTVDYWTNVSEAAGAEVGNSSTFLTFQEAYPNANRPVLVCRHSNGWDAWVVQVEDTGAAFTASFNVLRDDGGRKVRDYDFSFSPSGREVAGVSGTGLYLYDWVDTGAVPYLANQRHLTPAAPWLTSVDWR